MYLYLIQCRKSVFLYELIIYKTISKVVELFFVMNKKKKYTNV